MKELLLTAKQSASRLLEKWTRAQKISASVLAAVLVVVVTSAWTAGGGGEYRPLYTGRPRDAQPLKALLERHGIDWRSRNVGEGRVEVQVLSGQDHRRAFEIAERDGFVVSPVSETVSIDREGGLFLPPERLRIRVENSKRLMVEEAILFNPRIASVRFIVSRSPRKLLDPGPGKITAAVGLQLKPHVDSLTEGEAGNIRDLVSGAFDVQPENIQIVDHRGNRYLPSSKSARVRETEERIKERIRREVERLFLSQYRRHEFELGVVVNVSSRSEETERTEELESGNDGARSPSEERESGDEAAGRPVAEGPVAGVVRSITATKQTVPAGEVAGVGVTLALDLKAVKRVLETEDAVARRDAPVPPVSPAEFQKRVEEYEKEQVALLEGLVRYPGTRIQVKARPFTAAGDLRDEDVAGALLADAASAPWATIAVLAGGAAFLALVVTASLRRRRRSSSAGVAEEGRSSGIGVPEGLSACRSTLELAREASRVVRERPDVASSIIRLWLAEGAAGQAPAPPAGDDGREKSGPRETRLAPERSVSWN